jgi:hypothetical protein
MTQNSNKKHIGVLTYPIFECTRHTTNKIIANQYASLTMHLKHEELFGFQLAIQYSIIDCVVDAMSKIRFKEDTQ